MKQFAAFIFSVVVLLDLGAGRLAAQATGEQSEATASQAPGDPAAGHFGHQPLPDGGFHALDGDFGTRSITDIVDPRGSIRPQLDWQLGLGVFQPEWSNDNFMIVVPRAAAPAFGFSGKGRVDDFDYKPALTVNFQAKAPAAFGQGTAFIYTRLELIGRMNENPESSADRAFFDTTSVVRNEEYRMQLVEWSFPPLPVQTNGQVLLIEEDAPRLTFLFDISYRDMFQQFNSTLTRGENVSQLRAEARFQALGVAPVLKYRHPFSVPGTGLLVMTVPQTVTVGEEHHVVVTEKHIAPFALFCNVGGNFAIGENERFSSRIVTVTAAGAVGSDDRARLNRTEFVAAGGFDVGLEWNNVRDNSLFSAIVAFTAEASSGIGPIDPADVSPGSNNFLLYGLLIAGALKF